MGGRSIAAAIIAAWAAVLLPGIAASNESSGAEPAVEPMAVDSDTSKNDEGPRNDTPPEGSAEDFKEFATEAPDLDHEPEESPPAPADATELGLDDLAPFDLDLDQIDLHDELALLAAEDIVISASRRPQRIEESPSAITLITREQIRASGYDNLVDLMRLVPGADVHHITQGLGAVGIRSRSTWGGDRLLVLVDGRDVAVHLFGIPMWMAMPFDIDSIERIEIIRGPGSTLYGANALQGVVNIVTRRPTDEGHEVELTAGLAGLNTTALNARAHGRIGSWRYWASGGVDRRAPYALPDEVCSRSAAGRLFFVWDGLEETAVQLETGITSLEGHMVSFVGDGPADILWPYLAARLSMPGTEILAVLDWSDVIMDLDLGLVYPVDPEEPPLATAPLLRFPARSAELTAHRSFELFEGNTLMVGASARAIHHLEGSLISCPPIDFSAFDPEDCEPIDLWELRLGFFLQDEWYISDDILLNVGGRLDHNSLTAQPGISPRAALVYSPSPGQAVRFSYGRAYRKPTFSESELAVDLIRGPRTPPDMFLRLQHLFGNIGTRDLVNEYVDSIELGARGRFLDERLTISVDTFIAQFQHAIYAHARNIEPEPGIGDIETIPADASIGFENQKEDIRSYGLEAQVAGRPWPWLELSGIYGLDRMYNQKIDPDTDEATWQLYRLWEPHHRLVGSARVSKGQLRLGLDAIWMSRYRTNTRDPVSVLAPYINQPVGAATLLNGSLSYHLRAPGERSVEIGMAVMNILDQPYREVGAYDDEDGRALGGGEVIGRRGRLFVRGRF